MDAQGAGWDTQRISAAAARGKAMSQPKTLAEFVEQVADKLVHPVRFIEEVHLPADMIAHYEAMPDAIFLGTRAYRQLVKGLS